MSENIKQGDRVRVTIEAPVVRVWSDGSPTDRGLTLGVGGTFRHLLPHSVVKDEAVSVEKIEPPVEVFKVGDVVRRKGGAAADFSFALGRDGYFDILNGIFNPYDNGVSLKQFSSHYYEKVNL